MTRRRSLLLGFAFGAVAALGHAPFPLLTPWVWPFVLLSLLGFVALIRVILTSGRPVLSTWAGGAGYFAVALHWIVEPFLVEPDVHGWMAPFALIFMASGLALFWGFGAWLGQRAGGGALMLALGLGLGELARGHLFTGFPWAMPAYIWTETPLRMMAAAVGPYGLTVLTFLLTAFVAAGTKWHGAARGLMAITLVVAGLGVSFLQMPKWSSDGFGSVLLAQPDARQDEKWDPEKGPAFVRSLIEMSAEAADGAIDMVVWPETAVPYALEVAGPVLETASASAGGTPILTGINRRDDGAWFNALVTIGAGGEVTGTYDKVHLVPFGEYIPFRIDFLRAMASMSNFGFSAGDEVRLIDTPIGTALPLICYEAIFPGHGRGAGRPDYLLQITNDAWFGTFAGPEQHFQQARFRAVEQGLPLVRVANRGISAVIGPGGVVQDRMDPGTPGALTTFVPHGAGPTLYSRIGDLPVALILIAAFAGVWARKKIASRAPAS